MSLVSGQSFGIVPVPNLNPAVYALVIVNPDGVTPYATFLFPISPSSLQQTLPSMTNTYLVEGKNQKQGVARLADIYGIGPPRFVIQGTTGWARKSSDGYILTGLQAIQTLKMLINKWAELNTTQVKSGSPLYTMELYDYFSSSFWSVVPMDGIDFSQDNNRPLDTNYKIVLDAISDVAGTPAVLDGEADALLQVFATPVLAAAASAAITIAGSFNLYEPGVLSAVQSLNAGASKIASSL